MPTSQVAVRLSHEELDRLDRAVEALHSSRSEVIRRALEVYLYQLECERDARVYERQPLSDAELALADDPDAWAGTPTW